MDFILFPLVLVFWLPALVAVIDIASFIVRGRQFVNLRLFRFTEIVAIAVSPFAYIMLDTENNCCSDSAVFAPGHLLTPVIFILLYITAYFYSTYRTLTAPPVLEVLVNAALILAIIFNIFVGIHTDDIFLAGFGNFPIIAFMLFALINNHRLFMEEYRENASTPQSKAGAIAWKILLLKPLAKYPILLLLCLPLTVLVICLLLLFGQKPDSIIKAFTDTYRHGFSQLDYECDKVICEGHYLCTVAANGHQNIVKPQRLGIRNGGTIICNRQLLVSNAFEELLQDKMPRTHRYIRRNYNKVGNTIRRHYHVFDNKAVSDAIYLIMKPAEWIFIAVLYTFDKNPENRIAKQYIKKEHRNAIDNALRKIPAWPGARHPKTQHSSSL
ncbi:DUF6688 domain-containing protein [Flavobacterium sp.]|uniref:DUF6688 domain-containing protein n=2 Tax=Flavobacterium sp. TaxID=239 RepID=UPI004033C20D